MGLQKFSQRMINKLWRVLACIIICSSYSLLGTTSYATPNGEGIQTYQKNIHLSPEHKQKLADDITRYRNANNFWDVLREEFSLPHYEESYAVQAKIQWFMNNQDYLLRATSRAAPYLYYISQQVRKKHLPAELVLLPIVESGYNPFSVSSMGATGIWQLMPDTASGYGVKRDWWYDGRRDIIASTRAALTYLAYLQSFFEGNWLLAIAAYNTGEGNVLAAIKRNIREGRDTDFWSLPVAQETRDYVPTLLALAIIISRPDKYPVYFPPVRNAPYLAQMDLGSKINLKYAAKLAGISHDKLMQLNPGFTGASTSNSGSYKLVLPIETVEQFTENLARSPLNEPIDWQHYRVKSGDSLASISKKFTTNIADIRKMNHLNKPVVRPGTNLLIPSGHKARPSYPEDEEEGPPIEDLIASNESRPKDIAKIARKIRESEDIVPVITASKSSKKYTLQPGDTIYMVRRGDTVEKVAKHFRISKQALTAANQLRFGKLIPNKQIVIPTHQTISIKPTRAYSTNKLRPGDTIYMVRRDDTLEKIAKKFQTTASAIRLTNLIDNQTLSVGDNIVIPSHFHG